MELLNILSGDTVVGRFVKLLQEAYEIVLELDEILSQEYLALMTDLTLTHRLRHHLDQVLVVRQLPHDHLLRTAPLCRRLFDLFIAALFPIDYPVQVLLQFLVFLTHIRFSLDVLHKFGISKFALVTFAERIHNGFVDQDVESRELRVA